MRSFVQSSAQCSCPFATLCNRTTTPASHQYLLPRPANLTPRPQLTPPLLSTRTLCRRAAGCCMNAMRSRNRTVHAMHAHTLCTTRPVAHAANATIDYPSRAVRWKTCGAPCMSTSTCDACCSARRASVQPASPESPQPGCWRTRTTASSPGHAGSPSCAQISHSQAHRRARRRSAAFLCHRESPGAQARGGCAGAGSEWPGQWPHELCSRHLTQHRMVRR